MGYVSFKRLVRGLEFQRLIDQLRSKNVLFNVFVVGLANCISLLKNIMNSNKSIVKRHTVWSFFFMLASRRVISGIMYWTAVIIRKISPERTNWTPSRRRGVWVVLSVLIFPIMTANLYNIPYITAEVQLWIIKWKKVMLFFFYYSLRLTWSLLTFKPVCPGSKAVC